MEQKQGTQAIELSVSFDHEPTEDDMIRLKRSLEYSFIGAKVPVANIRYSGPTKISDSEWRLTASGTPVERPRTPDEAGYGARHGG